MIKSTLQEKALSLLHERFAVPYVLTSYNGQPNVDVTFGLTGERLFIPTGNNSHVSFDANKIAGAKRWDRRATILGAFDAFRDSYTNDLPLGYYIARAVLKNDSPVLDLTVEPTVFTVGLRSAVDVDCLRAAGAELLKRSPSRVAHFLAFPALVTLVQKNELS